MLIKEINAKETYQLRHEVMWPDRDLSYIILDKDEEAKHFGLYIESSLIAVVSIFIDNENAQFRKFAAKKSEQGKGYGSLLLNHLMNFVSKEKHIKKLWCNARIDKTYFYEKFGLEKTKEHFTKGGKEYVIMEKSFR